VDLGINKLRKFKRPIFYN